MEQKKSDGHLCLCGKEIQSRLVPDSGCGSTTYYPEFCEECEKAQKERAKLLANFNSI